ncbi:type VI secretion system lipoprotein TssJ [Vibrio metschnikovii]|uniref:type VI secretion system lipoprotein TssJ n=1 Tax=Vibrio metschnikovii TaxID=28172 RepID=UPI001C30D703|nr:type VI secretion system lipoprotein TssJ [Vibrio metschnikovii]EKO3564622.1 type VI secretion system lipoprotein TssJ [Vibrio metschnikovii]EKO3769313.1 type VI secretion system lipoprotein TssJ [Vibrio metschnikovii]
MKIVMKFLSIVSISLLVGCSVVNMIVPPYSKVEVIAGDNINPDMNGRPSPVVIHIFELTSDTLFKNQGFFSLYENSDESLGPDMISKTEMSLSPGQSELYRSSMKPGVEYIGVIVAFRDIENANWRKVIRVDRTGYKKYTLLLDELTLAIK